MAYLAAKRACRVPLGLLFIIILLGIGACSQQGTTPLEHIKRAKAARAEGQYSKAIIELKNALQEKPDHAGGRWLLGQIYIDLKDGEGAEKELDRAAKLGIPERDIWVDKTYAVLLQRDFERLVSEFDPANAPELDPRDEAILLALNAEAHIALGKAQTASNALSKAKDLSPQAPEVLARAARLEAATGNGEKAREILHALLDREPSFAEGWRTLGDVELAGSRFEYAIEAYTEALSHTPRYPEVRFRRALANLSQERLKAARSDANKLKATPGFSVAGEYLLGATALVEGQPGKAQGHFERTLQADYRPGLSALYLGLAHLSQGQLEQASSYLSRAVQARKHMVQPRLALAVAHLRSGNADGAVEVLQEIKEPGAKHPMVLGLLGQALVVQGKTQEGLSYLERASKADPERSAMYRTMGLGMVGHISSLEDADKLRQLIQGEEESPWVTQGLYRAYLRVGAWEKALELANAIVDKAPKEAAAYNRVATVFLLQGEEDKALTWLDRGLEQDSKHVPTLLNKASLMERRGQLGEAESLYRRILEVGSGGPAYAGLARVMAGQAGVGKAVERLEEQLAEESSAPPGLRLTLAELYIQQGRVSKADGVLQPLEGSDALPAAVDLVWGRVELAKGDWPLAADRLEAYTKKHPGHAYGHYLLARSYAQAGRQGEAQAALERALKADPGAEAARLTLARIALRKGQLEEAQSHVERLSRLKSPDVYDLMARLAAERGDFQEAVSVYQEARANYPHDLNLALGHAQALALKGSPESGLNLMQDWVADHPDDLGGRHALAQIYLSLGKREQARETYQAIVEARGRDPVALNNLAMLLKEHNPDQALIYAQRAYEAAPESLTVIDTMAGLLIEQGDFQRALQVLETAQKSNGSRQTIQLLQAKALLGLGRRDQARGLLQQVAKDPDYKERAEALLP